MKGLGHIILFAAWVLAQSTLFPATTRAQDLSVFDEQGNLVRMPFEPDIPVVRSVTRQEGDSLSFVTFSSLPYARAVEHYRSMYNRQQELAPGWRLLGYGFDVVANAHVFTLAFAEQLYRLEVHPDQETGGSILIVRSGGGAAGFQPYMHSLMPFRAPDVGPIEIPVE